MTGVNIISDTTGKEIANAIATQNRLLAGQTTTQNSDTTTVTYTSNDPNCKIGYYQSQDNQVVFTPNIDYKCLEIKIDNHDGYFTPSRTNSHGFLCLIKNINGTMAQGYLGVVTSLKDIDTLYINFYKDDVQLITLNFNEKISKQELNADVISPLIVGKSFTYTLENTEFENGFYDSALTLNHDNPHRAVAIDIGDDDCYLSYTTVDNLASYLNFAYLVKSDGSYVGTGQTSATNIPLKGYSKLLFNFFTGGNYAKSFTITKNRVEDDTNTTQSPYDDYLLNTYDWQSKLCRFAGDSITRGYTSGTTTTQNTYPKLFCDYVGATQNNISLASALYTEGYNNVDTLLEQITKATNKDTVDYLFLAGGVNDFQLNVPIAEFKTAVENTIDYALANYPNAHIIIITPINQTIFAKKLHPLQLYRNVITEVAIQKDINNRISIVQGYKFDFPDSTNSSTFISAMYGDGLHPTELGYRTAYLRGLIKAIG